MNYYLFLGFVRLFQGKYKIIFYFFMTPEPPTRPYILAFNSKQYKLFIKFAKTRKN